MLKCLLAPAALLYKAGVTFRHRLFDWGILKSEKFDIPIICIGNITVGGTGKTPMAEMVIAYMRQPHNVALLYDASSCGSIPVIRNLEEYYDNDLLLEVKGILNVQFAICNDEVYIIEANPRASRTVPIVSKVTGISLARYATEIMLGKKLKDLGLKPRACRFIGVKEAVFPFNMFPEVDPVLGPEMRATGEVMGIADNFGMAYYKAQEAAGCILPTAGKVLVTVSDRDKKFIEPIARDLISLGFTIVSTGGTAEYLRGQGVETEVVNKLHEGRPNLGDMITNKQIDLIINTPVDRTSMIDDSFIRMQSIQKKIPYMTTIAAARATVEGIRSAQHVKVSPRSLQEYHS